jgi:PAS domain S-box-containing protein
MTQARFLPYASRGPPFEVAASHPARPRIPLIPETAPHAAIVPAWRPHGPRFKVLGRLLAVLAALALLALASTAYERRSAARQLEAFRLWGETWQPARAAAATLEAAGAAYAAGVSCGGAGHGAAERAAGEVDRVLGSLAVLPAQETAALSARWRTLREAGRARCEASHDLSARSAALDDAHAAFASASRALGGTLDARLATALAAWRAQAEGKAFASDALMGTLVLSLAVIGLLMVRWSRALMAAFLAATERVGHGDLSSRLPEGRDDEIGMLAVHFNRMTAMLEGTTVTKGSLEASQAALARVNESLAGRLEESKRLQRAVLTAAAEWRLSLDALPMPVVVLDGEGRVRRLNRAAALLAGRETEACVGLPVEELEPSQPWRAMRDLWEHRQGSQAQLISVREGSRTFAVTLHLISDHEGGRELWLARAKDATRDVELHERLKREGRVADLGRFVAGIAHEVRNPLFGILANLDAWEDEAGTGMNEFGQRIRREAQRLQEFMNDLLDYGRPVQVNRERVALPAVWRGIEPAIRPAADRAGIRLQTPNGGDGPYVVGDERRLGQALSNLMMNAIQHTPAGGTVSLRAEEGAEYDDCVVTDTGTGFEAAALVSAFEPFYTRRQGGTGLGLAIVKRFVEDMGGSVAASNRPGGGAEVRLRFFRKREERER